MPLNLNVGAVQAVVRPTPALKPTLKQESAASKPDRGDTAEVGGRSQLAPAAGYDLAGALAAVASVRQNPAAALAAQANVRPQVAIVLAG